MYIIAIKGEYSDEASHEIQRRVRERGGLILMATRTGPIVAMDDTEAKVIASHPRVAHLGPITLNPHGFAADRLTKVFAENLSKQIQSIQAMPREEPGEDGPAVLEKEKEQQLSRFKQGGRPWA
jgi:hypothetical protein